MNRLATDRVQWPSLLVVAATLGLASDGARELQRRVLTQWGKNKFISQVRGDLARLLAEQGGVMTAVELAEAMLLRRGSVQPSPTRERWVLRRAGKRVLIAEDTEGQGEALASNSPKARCSAPPGSRWRMCTIVYSSSGIIQRRGK
jgi:hypothetical protein